jgi:hypothetical protein
MLPAFWSVSRVTQSEKNLVETSNEGKGMVICSYHLDDTLTDRHKGASQDSVSQFFVEFQERIGKGQFPGDVRQVHCCEQPLSVVECWNKVIIRNGLPPVK